MTEEMKPDILDSLRKEAVELDIAVRNANHDYKKHVAQAADMMQQRYPVDHLKHHEEDLDHFTWHQQAFQQAMDKHGDPTPIPENAQQRYDREQQEAQLERDQA